MATGPEARARIGRGRGERDGDENEGGVICVWGGRKTLYINGDEVHGCPLRARSADGAIPLSDCKNCGSHVRVL